MKVYKAPIVAAAGLLAACALTPPPEFDVVIAGGDVVDGTGAPGFVADVGLKDRRIAAIGDLSDATAERRIDATDRVVAPGFIDMHSHASYSYLIDSRALSKISQGITLEIEGEGGSVAPVSGVLAEELDAALEQAGVEERWRSLDEFFDVLERNPGTVNFATYLGTSNVREMTVGYEDRPATPDELDAMRAIVDEAMRDGALGVYSALMYSPDHYNSTEELIAMAEVAARYGGRYQTHPRSESSGVQASMTEIERIAREGGLPAHITHVKVTHVQNWGRIQEVIDFVERANAEGLTVTADMYPYERAGGRFTSLLPPWAQEGGPGEIRRRLNDPAERERIKVDLVTPSEEWENEYLGANGSPAGLTFVRALSDASLDAYVGMTLAEIAEERGVDPRDAMFDIILQGDAVITSWITSEDDIRRIMLEPWVAFGTDGEDVAPDGPLSEGAVHPRAYGTFPRIFGVYVRELGLISLEEAVRRSTSLPAQILEIPDRGVLAEGAYADVVVFNPDTIIDRATFEEPHQLSTGVDYVLVNGEVVFEDGRATDARPGMVVRGPGHQAQ